jgi:hypothetical protein
VAAATTASPCKSVGRGEGDANCRHSGKKKSDLSAHGTYLSQEDRTIATICPIQPAGKRLCSPYRFDRRRPKASTSSARLMKFARQFRNVLGRAVKCRYSAQTPFEKKHSGGIALLFFSRARGSGKIRSDTSIHRKDCLGGETLAISTGVSRKWRHERVGGVPCGEQLVSRGESLSPHPIAGSWLADIASPTAETMLTICRMIEHRCRVTTGAIPGRLRSCCQPLRELQWRVRSNGTWFAATGHIPLVQVPAKESLLVRATS